ncbi:hypothetical protein C8R47DRAFT_1150086, partial [Mycena vitilis]
MEHKVKYLSSPVQLGRNTARGPRFSGTLVEDSSRRLSSMRPSKAFAAIKRPLKDCIRLTTFESRSRFSRRITRIPFFWPSSVGVATRTSAIAGENSARNNQVSPGSERLPQGLPSVPPVGGNTKKKETGGQGKLSKTQSYRRMRRCLSWEDMYLEGAITYEASRQRPVSSEPGPNWAQPQSEIWQDDRISDRAGREGQPSAHVSFFRERVWDIIGAASPLRIVN